MNPPNTSNGLIPVRVSVGACLASPGVDITAMDLIRLPDKALYKAKENGRDQYVIEFSN